MKARDPGPVKFWPSLRSKEEFLPIVFCHVEGVEQTTVITTSHSNERSKSNMKEVSKAVSINALSCYCLNKAKTFYKPSGSLEHCHIAYLRFNLLC